MMSYSQVFLQIMFQHCPLADIALFTLFFWIEVLPLLVAPEPPGGGGDVVAVLAGEEDTARVEVLQVILETLGELKILIAMLIFVHFSLLSVPDSLVSVEVHITLCREVTLITVKESYALHRKIMIP